MHAYIWALRIITYVHRKLPGMGIVKSALAVVGTIELINTSHWYTLPISLIFSDGMMNESLYTDVELILLLAVTLLTFLTCVSPVVHMMSTVPLISLTMIVVHCNINGW